MDVRERVAKRMRLIVGLGNPGPEYAWTPHNLGFLVVDRLAELGGMRVERPEGKACIGRGQLAGQEVLLAKPQTYVNLSGLAVRELLSRFECDPAEMIEQAAGAVAMILTEGVARAMNRFNRRVPPPGEISI